MKKVSDYNFDDQMKFYRLLDLQRKLRAFDYDCLGLEYLDPLRNEIARVLNKKYEVNHDR